MVADQKSGTVFVGRERELQELLRGLDQAATGRGGLVLIRGEPGIGKSRLADELATRARERGVRVLWGRAWTDAGAPPYWPWIQVLRSLVRATGADRLAAQLGVGAADLAQVLPELRGTAGEPPRPADPDPEAARFRLFDSTVTFLLNASHDRPLLLVIDDLQAADTASVLLLRFLADQLPEMAALVVCTVREIELEPDQPVAAALDELAREPSTRTLDLRGLEQAAVGAYIGATTDAAPAEQLVAAVWRATGGNPLFVGEALRLLSAEGRLDDLADQASLRVVVPAGVRAVIRRRIDRLGASTAFVLLLGAVLGPEFRLDVLRRVGGEQAREASADIDAAVRAGLILPVGGAVGRYRFSHDLVRETLYDELSPLQRAQLHRRIGEVLEELYGADLELHFAELAFHFVEAARGDPSDDPAQGDAGARRAAHYAARAGDAATAALAYEEAARLYRMAIAAVEALALPADQDRVQLLLALGDALSRAGDFAESRRIFLRSADLARRMGSESLLAASAFGYGGRQPWVRAGRDTRLVPLLQDALVMLGGADPPLRVRLLTRLACAWRSEPQRRSDSAALSAQAVELARELGDPATLAYALAGRFWATWWPENPSDRQIVARELSEVASTLDDPERLADAHLIMFLVNSELGHMAEAQREMEALGRQVEELRQPATMWLGGANDAQLAMMRGELVLAERLIGQEGSARHESTPGRDGESVVRFQRFLLRRLQGRGAEEESSVRQAIDDFPWYPFHRAALACLLLDAGRNGEARRVLRDLLEDDRHGIYRDNEWFLGICLSAEAATVLGEQVSAQWLYDELLPFAGRHAVGYAEGSLGAADRYLGLLAGALDRPDDAVAHFEAAISLNDAMGARPWSALTQHDLAELIRKRSSPGDEERAAALDVQAFGTAAELGMALADQILTSGGSGSEDEPAVPGASGGRSPDVAAVDRAADRAATSAILAAATGSDGTAGPTAPAGAVSAAVFRPEGEFWTVRFDGSAFSMRDARGMHHLARLLEHPGREFHALDLVASPDRGRPTAAGVAAAEGLASDRGSGTGPMIDAQARAAYRERLEDLQAEIAEAEAWNDPERAARAEDELDTLTRQLAAAVGLGGRDRDPGSAAERARVSVTRAIRSAMDRLALQSPSMGAHLDATIRTGIYCSYTPDPRAPIAWNAPAREDEGVPADPATVL